MFSSVSNSKQGFTLIELLIVVAIIAILAAIAIPNFLAAQIRSKVSRTKSDMRTLSTGFESYMVDNNAYPAEYLFSGYPEMIRIQKSQSHLTTPIAYITSLPMDPFKSNDQWSPPVYWYYNWLERYGREINPHVFLGNCPWYDELAAYMLTSIGPNFTPNWPIPYDPTNGIVSNGDIVRFGPGGGGSR